MLNLPQSTTYIGHATFVCSYRLMKTLQLVTLNMNAPRIGWYSVQKSQMKRDSRYERGIRLIGIGKDYVSMLLIMKTVQRSSCVIGLTVNWKKSCGIEN